MEGKIYQINLKPRIEGERGIPKHVVTSAYLSFKGFEGDFNHFRTEKKASTLDRAVLVIPIETIFKLNQEEWPVEAGHLGENITSEGIPYERFNIGRQYEIGEAVIKISEVCKPCTVLHNLPYVGLLKSSKFIKTLIGRRGMYAKVEKEGLVKAGDSIRELFI